MKIVIKIVLILLIAVTGIGFSFGQQTFTSSFVTRQANQDGLEINRFVPDFRFSLGTNFGSFYPGAHYFSSYVGVESGTKVTNRLHLAAGVKLRSVFMGSSEGRGSLMSGSQMNFGSLYIKGDYSINNHLTLTAIGYKTINLGSAFAGEEKINPHALDLTNQGVMINLNYKVNDNFQIDASFSYDKGHYNPYYYGNSLMNGGFNHPAVGAFGRYRPGF
ncbi:MAG: hypothetical protein DRJ09_12370 [Bacteroidetes bacterium]|nr:MAG: hypothetical protein DRJ09_12370 [Bacteroidota bacterium]